MKISANLGFLYRDRPLADAIRAVRTAGFGAVEMHWPYEDDPIAIEALLAELAMPLPGINTPLGDPARGEFGLCALPGCETEARASIDTAIVWARLSGARNIHVMAGRRTTRPRSARSPTISPTRSKGPARTISAFSSSR